MKYIKKSNYPSLLLKWRKENNNNPNKSFKDLPRLVKAELKEIVIKEQFFLCGYTGLRIDLGNSHIEHMIPQETSKSMNRPEETTDYCNLIAASNEQEYGAVKKDNWPKENEKHLFLKPTEVSCETRLKYLKTGEVEPTNPDDIPAKTTIDKLNLNHPDLKQYRKQIILDLFISNVKIDKSFFKKRLIKAQEPNNGKLDELSFVIIQYLEKKIKQAI